MHDDREVLENKMLLLYLIKELSIPVNNMQLTKIMLENKFMNYFFMQHYISELIKDEHLLSEGQDGNVFYCITPKGDQILNMFKTYLPKGLRNRINKSIASLRKNIRLETSIVSDYTPLEEGGYNVALKFLEGSQALLEVHIVTGSREDSRQICKNWADYPQEVYSEILESLLKNRNLKVHE